jgi:CheY-like chemotaxis protein
MEAVGQLTGGVAHDFNHLLAVIATNIELGASLSESAAARERLEAGLRAVERGHQITQRLLAFSRRRPLRAAVTDLRQKLPELKELLEPSIGRQVTLAVEAAPDVWPVRIDDGELQVALLNLVVNARDAMPDGGTVRVSVDNLVLPVGGRPAELHGLPSDVVAITVADTGSGIPPAILGRIFEPFFTTKGEGQGSGLGLAQVYAFAKQSGGAVTVDSELGRGAIVTLYLPRLVTATPAVPPSPARPAPLAWADGGRFEGEPRILVVDDEKDSAEVTTALLTRLGCRVTVADRARRALSILGEDAAYDLVFSDIAMPDGMNGIELAAIIEHRHPGLPVLLTTGNPQRERLAMAAGREVLQKPYAVNVLIATLKRHLQNATMPAPTSATD